MASLNLACFPYINGTKEDHTELLFNFCNVRNLFEI